MGISISNIESWKSRKAYVKDNVFSFLIFRMSIQGQIVIFAYKPFFFKLLRIVDQWI